MTTKQNHFNKNIIVAMLLVITIGFNFDFYLPGLPIITIDLQTSNTLSRMSVPMFLIGLGIGQFTFGLLVDIWFRKKII